MNYGYIRVSTDKQTVENQRYEITDFAQKNGIQIDEWIEETISGTLEPNRRQQGTLLERIQKDDLIICSELSRLGDDIQSKVLAFAFGLSAEIERNLISQRTKEALERKKSEGMILCRPKGKVSNISKLDGAEFGTTLMLMQGISVNRIANL